MPRARRTPPSDLNHIQPTGAHGGRLGRATGSQGSWGLFGGRTGNHVDRRAARPVRSSDSARPGIPIHTGVALRTAEDGPLSDIRRSVIPDRGSAEMRRAVSHLWG